MKKIVVDTTVIIKWLNRGNELNIEQADKLLEDVYAGKIVLMAPELAKNEVGKVLLFAKKLTQTESKTPLGLLFDLPIEFVSSSLELAKNSYAIASAYGLSYSESTYLALAEQRGAILVTEKVDKNALETGVKIIALKDY